MTPAERMHRLRTLRPLGYVAVRLGNEPAGWVPAKFADRIREQIELHRKDVEAAVPPIRQSEGWEG